MNEQETAKRRSDRACDDLAEVIHAHDWVASVDPHVSLPLIERWSTRSVLGVHSFWDSVGSGRRGDGCGDVPRSGGK
jgi:hypothetical protein